MYPDRSHPERKLGVVLKRLSLLTVAGLLAGLVWTAAVSGKDASIYVPQASPSGARPHFSVRPKTLRFAYQPPGSYGDEETKGRGLYPPSRSPSWSIGTSGASSPRPKPPPRAGSTTT